MQLISGVRIVADFKLHRAGSVRVVLIKFVIGNGDAGTVRRRPAKLNEKIVARSRAAVRGALNTNSVVVKGAVESLAVMQHARADVEARSVRTRERVRIDVERKCNLVARTARLQ